MLHTLIYKFKKRELTDTPPDITATNSNWDIVEVELNKLYDKINALSASIGADGLKEIVDIDDANSLPLGNYLGNNLKNAPDVGYLEYSTSNWFSKGNDYRVQVVKNGMGKTWTRGRTPYGWYDWIASIDKLGYQYAPSHIKHPKDLPSGKWYLTSEYNPYPNTQYYIDCGENPVEGYKQFTAYDVYNTNMYIAILEGTSDGWSGWQKISAEK